MSFKICGAFAAAMSLLVASSACGGDDDGGSDAVDAGLNPAADAAPMPPTTITVSGTVVDSFGRPFDGASIYIEGFAPIVTDGSGGFSIEGVEPPYDLLVTSVEINTSTLFVGLVEANPTLTFVTTQRPVPRSATVEGTLTAGADSGFVDPNPAGTSTVWRMLVNGGSGGTTRGPASDISPFTVPVSWRNSAEVSGRLHVLQYVQDGDGLTTGFTGYGSKLVSGIADEDAASASTITMESVSAATVSGTVSLPEGATLLRLQSGVRLDDQNLFEPLADETSTAATTFSHLVPAIANATGCVLASASFAGGVFVGASQTGLTLPATDIALEVPDGFAVLTSPPDGASGIGIGSELTFEAPADAVHIVVIAPLDSAAGAILIATSENRVVIPDVAPFGVTLPSGMTYNWAVYTFFDHDRVDDADSAFRAVTQYCKEDSLRVAISAMRSFTTP